MIAKIIAIVAAIVAVAVVVAVAIPLGDAPDSEPATSSGSGDTPVGENVDPSGSVDSENDASVILPAGENDTSTISQSGTESPTIKEIESTDHLMEILYDAVSYDWRSGVIPQPSVMHREEIFMSASADFALEESSLSAAPPISDSSSKEHSDTNIQVVGVDEPDYIKNDGQYAYVVEDNTLTIIDVWPADDVELVTKVALDIGFTSHIQNMFLNGDRLVIFYVARSDNVVIPTYDFVPTRSSDSVTRVVVIDISDRQDPQIHKDYSIGGRFEDARMIGQHVYIVTTSWIDHSYPKLPVIWDGGAEIKITPRAFYFEDDWQFSTFTTLAAIDIFEDVITSETFMMGDTRTYYVSNDNFYLTYNQWLPHDFVDGVERERFFEVIVPLLPDDIQIEIAQKVRDVEDAKGSLGEWGAISKILQDYYNMMEPEEKDDLFERIQKALAAYDKSLAIEMTKTIIHKISIDGNDIDYVAQGSVPGRLLNQFSLGEDAAKDRLRVATTVEYPRQFDGSDRSNGVYVLDGQMNTVGKLEEIALDERIYSTRFMGDRLYMVTFEQIDPFFVIDISEDTPVILGELKIPGFSNYLHPYDDDHVIGIGRDTKVEPGGWPRQLGVKIALFNVSDVSNPTVVDDLIIGESSTHSEALRDHKAFFFDGRNKILSIPIVGPFNDLSATLDASELENTHSRDMDYHDNRRWTGFYILDVGPQDGVEVRGSVSHSAFTADLSWMDKPRTFYIEDVLYTVSNEVLSANDIDSLKNLGFVRLGGTGAMIDYIK